MTVFLAFLVGTAFGCWLRRGWNGAALTVARTNLRVAEGKAAHTHYLLELSRDSYAAHLEECSGQGEMIA